MNIVSEFQGEHRFLSNFWPSPLVFNDWMFPTAEHAYQAAKSPDPRDWQDVQQCVSPGAAKRLGRSITIRTDWEEVKVTIMTEIVATKFKDPKLRQMLLDTGDALLIDGNSWGDTFWGVCRGRGRNQLGRILMNVRQDIQIINQLEAQGFIIP